ncbi:hypothetical protein Ancab_019657 [Ancistrocladus abbreviatus]
MVQPEASFPDCLLAYDCLVLQECYPGISAQSARVVAQAALATMSLHQALTWGHSSKSFFDDLFLNQTSSCNQLPSKLVGRQVKLVDHARVRNVNTSHSYKITNMDKGRGASPINPRNLARRRDPPPISLKNLDSMVEETNGGLGGWEKTLQLNHEGSKGSSNIEWSKTLSRVLASPIRIYSNILEIHNVKAKTPEAKSPCGSEKASAQSTNCCLYYRKFKGNLHEIGALNAIGK